MRKPILAIIISFTIIFGSGFAVQAGIIGPELNAVLQSLGPDEEVAVIVSLADQADLKKIKDLDKAQKRSKIIKALKDKSDKTQKDLKNFMKQKNLPRQPRLLALRWQRPTVGGSMCEGFFGTRVRLKRQVKKRPPREVFAALLRATPSATTHAWHKMNSLAKRAPTGLKTRVVAATLSPRCSRL